MDRKIILVVKAEKVYFVKKIYAIKIESQRQTNLWKSWGKRNLVIV